MDPQNGHVQHKRELLQEQTSSYNRTAPYAVQRAIPSMRKSDEQRKMAQYALSTLLALLIVVPVHYKSTVGDMEKTPSILVG
jgi:hypothetical protein